MFSTSITIGATAITRLSTAAVSHAVQPRFDAPDTVNESIDAPQRSRTMLCIASIARTVLFTIGSSNGQSFSPVFRY